MNMMLFFATLLDSRYKLRFVRFCYADIYEFGKVEELGRRLMEEMKSIFDYYKMLDSIESSVSSRNKSSDGMEIDELDCEIDDVLDSEEE